MTVAASLALSSAVYASDSMLIGNNGVDVVAAATGTAPAPATPAKPTTPVKPTTTKPTTTPAKPTTTAPATTTPAATPAKVTYKDGVYVTYGNAYSKGTEGAKVTIKDGKIAAIELMRTSPKLIDRDARSNYQSLWQAYEVMKTRFIGKTREQAAKVDVVAGATRSSDGWKLSVDRAFEIAATTKDASKVYFDGEHMGIDPQGKYAVFVNIKNSYIYGIKVYALSKTGSFVEPAAISPEQAKAFYAVAGEVSYKGMAAEPVAGFEKETQTAKNALWDALENAKINKEVKYIDGFYSAYGDAGRQVGAERADIYVRNGKVVDVKLYRLGSDLIDRGATAYAEVVKANAPMVAKILENGSYFTKLDPKVDVMAGASESIHEWNVAVQNAMVKAQAVPTKSAYFDGIYVGVDHKSSIQVLVTIAGDKVTAVQSSLFDANKKLIRDAKLLTAEQADIVAKVNAGLLKDGVKMAAIAGQADLSKAAVAAFEDALTNASTSQGKYYDGTFTAYGHTYDKGTNRADVTLRNGKIVALKIARAGYDLQDRGASAYAEVVKNIGAYLKKFVNAGTRENVKKLDMTTEALKVDGIAGATATAHGLQEAIEGAYKKAEIVEPYKAAYLNGEFPGIDKAKSVYVIAKVEKNVPVAFTVYYLDAAGKVKANDKLTYAEMSIKKQIEAGNGTEMHPYAYRPAAFGGYDDEISTSARVIEAIVSSLENAGR